MSADKPTDPAGKATTDDPRAAALRANLARRKGQASARRSGKGVGKAERSAFDQLGDANKD